MHDAPIVTAAAKKQAARAAHYVYLQAGAFKSKAYAVKLKNRLTAMLTFPVRISHPVVNSKLYRVQIGPIQDSISAEKISRRLKSLGISANKIQES